ncbi:MAG: Fpg/Nei family DNA glycosylase [Theionarchaea archaeon]|nr:Fpg/Nei family DNA glycosylase [Theionarchaea archaeon]
MPELPDVETYKRYLDATSLHTPIHHVEVKSPDILSDDPETFRETVEGLSFHSTERHGKYLFVDTEKTWISFHFGMTGYFQYFKSPEDDPRHDRLLFTFSNDYHLAYVCMRKFGTVKLISQIQSFIEDKSLGPDTLPMDFSSFSQALEGRRGYIKSALMNQHIMAGIGNIYSDEILFQAHIHPQTSVANLSQDQLRTVWKKMQHILETAVDCQADPQKLPDSYLIPHRQEGERCPLDGHDLQRITVSGRTAYLCPHHQKKFTSR